MNQHFITQIHIDKVRHLQNITIPLSETTCKHLILTGKNGSGKTSVMEALKAYLSIYTGDSGTVDITRGVTAQFNDKESMQSRVYMGKYIFAYYEAIDYKIFSLLLFLNHFYQAFAYLQVYQLQRKLTNWLCFFYLWKT